MMTCLSSPGSLLMLGANVLLEPLSRETFCDFSSDRRRQGLTVRLSVGKRVGKLAVLLDHVGSSPQRIGNEAFVREKRASPCGMRPYMAWRRSRQAGRLPDGREHGCDDLPDEGENEKPDERDECDANQAPVRLPTPRSLARFGDDVRWDPPEREGK